MLSAAKDLFISFFPFPNLRPPPPCLKTLKATRIPPRLLRRQAPVKHKQENHNRLKPRLQQEPEARRKRYRVCPAGEGS